MADLNFLTGTFLIDTLNSPINGKINVFKSLAWGTYISVGGLTQSGGVVLGIWKKTLKKVRKSLPIVKSALILGLGGGSVAKVIKSLWPETEIFGVDIDELMVEAGKKYLGLNSLDVKVRIKDALDFVKEEVLEGKKYDLICVDLYCGDKFPKKFEKKNFIKCLEKITAGSGVVAINRLYYGEKRRESIEFLKILEGVFSRVVPIFPEANIIFVCRP